MSVDWSGWLEVTKTTAAANAAPDQRHLLDRVVVVPREVFDKYWPMPFSELAAAAFRGDDGLSPLVVWSFKDLAPRDVAYMHEHGKPNRSCLYSQGW